MATRVSSPVLVGRADERRTLAELVARASDGRSATLVIRGEAGLGKTRLVGELCRMAADAGALSAVGGCVPLGDGGVPYLPVSSAFSALFGQLDDATLRVVLGPGGGELVRILPGLAERVSGLAPASESAWARTSMFETIIAALDVLADHAPSVIVFEDLHWADPASLDLIAFLVQSSRRRRSLVAVTYRTDDLPRRHPLVPWLSEIGRLPSVERIALEPLDRAAMDALVTALPGPELSPEVRRDLWRRSGGNPFFLEELIAASRDGAVDRLPSSLRDVLLGRLDALDDGPRSLVDAVSVSEQEVTPELLAEVLGVPVTTVDAWTGPALDGHHLAVTDPESGALDVRHALLREAVVDSLRPQQRRRLHRAFAEALERRPAPEPARLAGWWAARSHHAIAAGELVAGLVASVAAGHAAFDGAGFEAARSHLEKAIALFDQVPDGETLIGEDRAALLSLAAEAADYIADDATTLRLRRAALEAMPADASAERRARALLDLADAEAFTEDAYERALALTTEAHERLRDRPASALRARAEGSMARQLGGAERWLEALVLSEKALETATATGDPSAIALAQTRHARSFAALGRQSEAEDMAESAVALARRSGDRYVVGLAYALAARIHEGAGDAAGAAAIHDQAAVVADELGFRLMDFEIVRAWNHFQIGDWSTTFDLIREHERRGPPYDPRFHLLGALATVYAGRSEEAASHLQALVEGERTTVAVVRADAALWMGRPNDAVAAAQRGLTSPPVPYALETWKGRLHRLLARAEADIAVQARRRRRLEEAAAAAARAAASAQALDDLMAGPVTYRDRFGNELPGSRALAHAEATRAADTPDPGLWAEAIRQWDTLGRPAEVAYAWWRRGEALLGGGGSRSDARQALAEAAAIARRLGAAPIVDAVEETARRARLRLGTSDPGDDAPAVEAAIGSTLTPREREVLALLCRGASNRQIASDLFISENTAGVHVSNIIGKLGVGSRTEAVAVAHMAGLVAAPTGRVSPA